MPHLFPIMQLLPPKCQFSKVTLKISKSFAKQIFGSGKHSLFTYLAKKYAVILRSDKTIYYLKYKLTFFAAIDGAQLNSTGSSAASA